METHRRMPCGDLEEPKGTPSQAKRNTWNRLSPRAHSLANILISDFQHPNYKRIDFYCFKLHSFGNL